MMTLFWQYTATMLNAPLAPQIAYRIIQRWLYEYFIIYTEIFTFHSYELNVSNYYTWTPNTQHNNGINIIQPIWGRRERMIIRFTTSSSLGIQYSFKTLKITYCCMRRYMYMYLQKYLHKFHKVKSKVWIKQKI